MTRRHAATALILLALLGVGARCTGPARIAGFGDSITNSFGPYYEDCGRPDWPCLLRVHHAVDLGVVGERLAQGAERVVSHLEAGLIGSDEYDYVTLFWATNDLINAIWPVSAPACPDVESCFVAHHRAAAEAVLAHGMRPVLWVPPPFRVFDNWDEGGCNAEGTLCLPQGGTRAYIRDVLRPAMLELAGELDVPIVDAFQAFVDLGAEMTFYYSGFWCYPDCKDGIHPTRGTDPAGPDGRRGSEIIAGLVDYAITRDQRR